MSHPLFLLNDTDIQIIAGMRSAKMAAGKSRQSVTSQILYFRDPILHLPQNGTGLSV